MTRLAIILLSIQMLGRAAEDPRLAQMRAILEPLRSHKIDTGDKIRGATPELTTVKHLLRDWIESRLPDAPEPIDPAALSKHLSQELLDAQLACDPEPHSQTPCPNQGFQGYVERIQIQRPGFLTVVTGVGIVCGFDSSAYIYKQTGGKWHRFFDSEQNDYRDKHYFPQNFASVQASSQWQTDTDHSEHLILTLGFEPWCASNWHDVYVRVWKTKASYPAPMLLIDQSEWAFEPWFVEGTVSPDDVLVEYKVAGGGHSRQEIRHYRVDSSDRVTRIDPLALSPPDFVEEWGMRQWETSTTWTERSARAKTKPAYEKL